MIIFYYSCRKRPTQLIVGSVQYNADKNNLLIAVMMVLLSTGFSTVPPEQRRESPFKLSSGGRIRRVEVNRKSSESSSSVFSVRVAEKLSSEKLRVVPTALAMLNPRVSLVGRVQVRPVDPTSIRHS